MIVVKTMIVTFHLRTLVGLFLLKVKKKNFLMKKESDMHHGTWINAGTERPRSFYWEPIK